MAAPSYFASAFIYKLYAAGTILDITNVIAAIRDALTVQLTAPNAWTESPSQTFTSPSDAGGRFIQLVLVRSSATLMTFKLVDRFGHSQTEGFVITGAGQALEISCSAAHMYMWLTDGTAWNMAALVDPTPEAINAMTTDTMVKSSHASGGGANSFNTLPDRWIAFGDAVAGYQSRSNGPWFTGSGAGPQLLTAGGSLLFLPVAAGVWPTASALAMRISGHFPHLVWVDQNAVGVLSVPIDNGVVGQFKQIAGILQQGVGFATQAGRLAARVG